MFFSTCPVAQARSAKPSADIGRPIANDRASGLENQANAATMMNPHVTRRRATRSAYGFGKKLMPASAILVGHKNRNKQLEHLIRCDLAHARIRLRSPAIG